MEEIINIDKVDAVYSEKIDDWFHSREDVIQEYMENCNVPVDLHNFAINCSVSLTIEGNLYKLDIMPHNDCPEGNRYGDNIRTYNLTIISGPLYDLYNGNAIVFNYTSGFRPYFIREKIMKTHISLTNPSKYLKHTVMPYSVNINIKKIFCILSYISYDKFTNEDLLNLITGKHNYIKQIFTNTISSIHVMMFVNGIYHLIRLKSPIGESATCMTCDEIGMKDDRHVDTIIKACNDDVSIDDIYQIISTRLYKRAQ